MCPWCLCLCLCHVFAFFFLFYWRTKKVYVDCSCCIEWKRWWMCRWLYPSLHCSQWWARRWPMPPDYYSHPHNKPFNQPTQDFWLKNYFPTNPRFLARNHFPWGFSTVSKAFLKMGSKETFLLVTTFLKIVTYLKCYIWHRYQIGCTKNLHFGGTIGLEIFSV